MSESAERVRKHRERERELKRQKAEEDAYVAWQVAITKQQMDDGLKDSVDQFGRTRLARSEAYARWRWREYHDGNVASL